MNIPLNIFLKQASFDLKCSQMRWRHREFTILSQAPKCEGLRSSLIISRPFSLGQKRILATGKVSIKAKTGVFTSVKYIKNVHIFRFDHLQWATSKNLGQDVRIRPPWRLKRKHCKPYIVSEIDTKQTCKQTDQWQGQTERERPVIIVCRALGVLNAGR